MEREPVRRPKAGPRRVVLSDETYDAIKVMILDHEISPGDHVGIDELARDLSVSQTPVREALARLESDGLVTKIPLRGYEATDLLSVQQFDELFQFRTLIEPWAAFEAAHRGSRRDHEALQAELERAERIEHSGSSSSYPELIEHDTRLHTMIAHASGNQFVEDAFVRTHCHLHLFRVYTASTRIDGGKDPEGEFVRNMFAEYYKHGDRSLALTEHEQIVSAIVGGDGESARKLMLHHIESSRLRFIPAVEALHAKA